MWKHANFHIVFDHYWLYRVSGMVDPKYLKSDVFGRYFVPTESCPCVGTVFSIHNHVETCKYPCGTFYNLSMAFSWLYA
jgi:hypothetical protein